MSFDVSKEIVAIGRMIDRAKFLMAVRQEVSNVMRDGFVVTDGEHGNSGYSVVVRCGGDGEMVSRRIKASMPDVDVDHIAEGVIGVRKYRRNR